MNSLLDETAIRKKLRLDALQHPMTILPAAFCILWIIYWVLLEDIIGGAGYILIIILSSAVVAAGSFLWLYFHSI